MTRTAATNLSVRTDLVQRARALGLHLSEILEAGLTAAIAEAERAQWLAPNQDARRPAGGPALGRRAHRRGAGAAATRP